MWIKLLLPWHQFVSNPPSILINWKKLETAGHWVWTYSDKLVAWTSLVSQFNSMWQWIYDEFQLIYRFPWRFILRRIPLAAVYRADFACNIFFVRSMRRSKQRTWSGSTKTHCSCYLNIRSYFHLLTPASNIGAHCSRMRKNRSFLFLKIVFELIHK